MPNPADRISKAQRWIDLIAALLGRRTPMTVDEIFEAVPAYRLKAGPEGTPDPASVRRMFERDKDELRELGIPIDSVKFRTNYGIDEEDGYVLPPAALYMPYVRIVEATSDEAARPAPDVARPAFTRGELELALAALREAAGIPGSPFAGATRSAYRKLAFDMDSAPAESGVRHLAPPGSTEIAAAVADLRDALRGRKRVEFSYRGLARGETTKRDVAPYGLFLDHGSWYLVGDDALRDARRVFHVGRMSGLRVNSRAPATPDYEIPENFSLARYVDRESWEIGDTGSVITASVRFDHPLSLWAARNDYGQLWEELEDGGSVRSFEVSAVRPFLCWLLGLRGDARLLEPAALVDELHAMAAEIAGAHE
ncbi:MAG: WYL domain-containing protein [Gemmatimonadales bacterium]